MRSVQDLFGMERACLTNKDLLNLPDLEADRDLQFKSTTASQGRPIDSSWSQRFD